MKKFFVLLLVLVFVCGCSEGLRTITKLDKEQTAQHNYVAAQIDKFNLLLEHIQDNTLKVGLSRKRVINTYGEPILVKNIEGYDRLLYRDPVDFDPAQKAYLYFDQEDRLIDFEVVIKETKEEPQEEVNPEPQEAPAPQEITPE